jgi:hypothetical protein
MILILSDDEANEVKLALNMRMAWIETGSAILRAHDVQALLDDDVDPSDVAGEVKPLSVSQMKVIIMLDQINSRLL